MIIKIEIPLELVETLVNENSQHQGCVILLEIRTEMQNYIARGLLRGCRVSLRDAFEFAWEELVFETNSHESLSDEMQLP